MEYLIHHLSQTLGHIGKCFLILGVPYQLDQLNDNQPRLSAFFAPKNKPVSEDALVHYENEDTSFKGGTQKDNKFSEVGESMQYGHQTNGDSDDTMHQNAAELIESTIQSEKSCDVRIVETSNLDAEGDNSVKDELQTNPHELSVSSYCSDNQDTKGLPTKAVSGSYRSHSTKDTNFVDNYFKVLKQ